MKTIDAVPSEDPLNQFEGQPTAGEKAMLKARGVNFDALPEDDANVRVDWVFTGLFVAGAIAAIGYGFY